MSATGGGFVLRKIGRAHVYGHYLYEVTASGQLIAKIAAKPEVAERMARAAVQPPAREPAAWRVRRHEAPDYWIVFLHKPVDALQDPEREVQPLYADHP